MTHNPEPFSSLFGTVDVSADSSMKQNSQSPSFGGDTDGLLRTLITGQERQSKLLEELVQLLGATQRQRATELGQWKEANPGLARHCRKAVEALGRVQTQFLETLTEEIDDNAEHMMDGEYMLNEFVDRFGPRLAHLNGVLQVLSQLSSVPDNSRSTL